MSSSNIYVIAEIGQAHDGSLGILHSYIDAISTTGVNAIKFQTHIAEAESSPHEPFRKKFSYEDLTRQDYWRRMEFTPDQWAGIKEHCEIVGLEFLSTPTCVAALDLLESLGVRRFKIGSGDLDNFLLLEHVSRARKQVILSSGISSFDELDATVLFLEKKGCSMVLMQSTSEYPVSAERLGLNLIPQFKKRYRHPIGLSDHSGSLFPSLAAVALGATYIETHVVFDRRMFGPDSTASITIDELRQLMAGVHMVERSMFSDFDKICSADQERTRSMFRKSLSVSRALPAGTILQLDHLESKKPSGFGIPARDYAQVIGKKLRRSCAKWEFLRGEDIE